MILSFRQPMVAYRILARSFLRANWAWALIVRVSDEGAARSRVQSLIADAEAEYPGVIEAEWGRTTLRISFVDESEHQSQDEPVE